MHLKGAFYKTLAGLTTLALSSPLLGFSATTGTSGTGTSGDVIGQGIGEVAKGIGEGSKEAISSSKYVIAFAMLVLLIVFMLLGSGGAFWWYRNAKGNPQQPANTVNALLWAGGGAVGGVVVWILLAIFLYKTIGLNIGATLKEAFGG